MNGRVIVLQGPGLQGLLDILSGKAPCVSQAAFASKLEGALESKQLSIEPDAAVELFNRAGGDNDKVPEQQANDIAKFTAFRLGQEALTRVVMASGDGEALGPTDTITKADVESFYAAGTCAQQFKQAEHAKEMKRLGYLNEREANKALEYYFEDHSLKLTDDAAPAVQDLLKRSFFAPTKDNMHELGYALSRAALMRAFNDAAFDDCDTITLKDVQYVRDSFEKNRSAKVNKAVEGLIAGEPLVNVLTNIISGPRKP